MSALSKKLRLAEGNRLHFWCPGCKEVHGIQFGDGPGPRWAWNGDADHPTFTPSVLTRSGHYASHFKAGDNCWCSWNKENPPDPGQRVFECGVCHSFVTNGRIQFLGDCTHSLAGTTVDLPEWTE